MGRSVNKVQIIGTLGRDPEMKYLPSGSAVVTVSVATDESYNDKNSGQKVEKTEWHRLTAFGKLAEIIGQYLKKGSRAYFEGKLRTNEYEKDGIKRYSTEIVVNDMMMLDSRQDAGVNQGFSNTAPMANNPTAAMGQQQGYAQPPQQPAQGYSQGQQQQAQRPVQQPQQGGFAPQQPAPQGGYAPQKPAPQPQQGGFAPQQPTQQGQQPQQAPQAAPQPANNFDSFDDDIPF
jgi:single-strand DNA-binding protein